PSCLFTVQCLPQLSPSYATFGKAPLFPKLLTFSLSLFLLIHVPQKHLRRPLKIHLLHQLLIMFSYSFTHFFKNQKYHMDPFLLNNSLFCSITVVSIHFFSFLSDPVLA